MISEMSTDMIKGMETEKGLHSSACSGRVLEKNSVCLTQVYRLGLYVNTSSIRSKSVIPSLVADSTRKEPLLRS